MAMKELDVDSSLTFLPAAGIGVLLTVTKVLGGFRASRHFSVSGDVSGEAPDPNMGHWGRSCAALAQTILDWTRAKSREWENSIRSALWGSLLSRPGCSMGAFPKEQLLHHPAPAASLSPSPGLAVQLHHPKRPAASPAASSCSSHSASCFGAPSASHSNSDLIRLPRVVPAPEASAPSAAPLSPASEVPTGPRSLTLNHADTGCRKTVAEAKLLRPRPTPAAS